MWWRVPLLVARIVPDFGGPAVVEQSQGTLHAQIGTAVPICLNLGPVLSHPHVITGMPVTDGAVCINPGEKLAVLQLLLDRFQQPARVPCVNNCRLGTFQCLLVSIFDLLGSASFYPVFVVIYTTFWVLIGALLLYDRPIREKVLILAVFVTLIFSLRFIDWNSRKPFLRSLYRIKEGMTHREVEQIMGCYTKSVGTNAQVDGDGYTVTGNVSYTHTDEGWGNSDIGLLTFQGGRVAEIAFLPD